MTNGEKLKFMENQDLLKTIAYMAEQWLEHTHICYGCEETKGTCKYHYALVQFKKALTKTEKTVE